MSMIEWLLEKPGRDYFDDIQSDSNIDSFNTAKNYTKRTNLNIMNLRVGDYVTYQNVDYYVRQRFLYKAGAYEWIAYQFSDNERQKYMWLDVEDDDGINIDMSVPIKLPSGVNLTMLKEKRSIKIDNELYEHDEYGRAQVKIERENKRWDSDVVEYWDYFNSDESKFLSFEKWGVDELETALGHPIKEYELEIFPGS